MSLNELLMRVGKGQTSAFEAFYDRTSGRVFSAVRAVVYDRAQSEEVTQEVFVELWRTAARFDPQRAGAHTWALTLAHRRAVDRVRSAQASVERESRWARLQSRAVNGDDVAETAETSSECVRVRKALLTLTALQREAICLAYFEGRTYGEVASLLGLPLGTVKTRMRDGLIKLRSQLSKAPELR
ncbi:MAG: ECF RNA polymerase sigma factor SigK [Actinomycetia bacterium]|nr:ECF RNA polymerase sigma factor SigK [Actinomycetes bacterium]